MDRLTATPHVLIFPYPAQGHINPMLNLAELLCLAGLHVTFVLTVYNHARLLRYTDVQSRFDRYPGFRFEAVPDGLPDDQLGSPDRLMELFNSLKATVKPLLRDSLISGHLSARAPIARPPVTCIISDGILGFVLEVAEELEIPILHFRTNSACAFWAYFSIPKLIESGELPFSGNDLDVPILNVPGMQGFLRRRDLPSFCRVDDLSNPSFQMVLTETQKSTRTRGFILNTFEELELPILSHIRTVMPNLYAIGPLHAHIKTRIGAKNYASSNSSNSLWEEDRSCMTWLDAQPLKSVLYISFGSFTVMTREMIMEFWHGLVNSKKRFLWVIRPESVTGKDGEGHFQAELLMETKERGYIVGWAPQERVLAHSAIGGFLTHSGWNSTMESIIEGVPMLCWAWFADQQVNSRFLAEVWKIGLDMKDICDRVVVEKMVTDLMELKKEELSEETAQMAKLAKQSISEGGSSYRNLDRLIQDIKQMSAHPLHSHY